MVNKQLKEEEDPPPASRKLSNKKRPSTSDPLESLGARVAAKLEEADFKGAVRLACSVDSMAAKSAATLSALNERHPSPQPDSTIPPPPVVIPNSIAVSEGEVASVIRSFPCGSAGGPDGLRPQHLKDLLNHTNGQVSSPFLSALAAFASLVLEGRMPPSVRPFFFGATLTALKKGDSHGVRPIAVGCTLHCLITKIAGKRSGRIWWHF